MDAALADDETVGQARFPRCIGRLDRSMRDLLTPLLRGIAEMTDRKRLFTEAAVLNTEATSGSRTIAIEPVAIRAANRLGRALL